MVYVWIAGLIGFIVIEALTVQLVTIWFAAGSLAALIAYALHASTFVQVLIFVAVSLLALIVTRPLVKKLTKQKFSPTNADRYIGSIAVVTEPIDNTRATGAANVKGTVWTARSQDGSIIKEGETVKVLSIDGVKLIVEKAKEPVTQE